MYDLVYNTRIIKLSPVEQKQDVASIVFFCSKLNVLKEVRKKWKSYKRTERKKKITNIII